MRIGFVQQRPVEQRVLPARTSDAPEHGLRACATATAARLAAHRAAVRTVSAALAAAPTTREA